MSSFQRDMSPSHPSRHLLSFHKLFQALRTGWTQHRSEPWHDPLPRACGSSRLPGLTPHQLCLGQGRCRPSSLPYCRVSRGQGRCRPSSLPYCLQRTGEMSSFFPPLLSPEDRGDVVLLPSPIAASPEDRGDVVLLPSPIVSRGQGRCRPSSLPYCRVSRGQGRCRPSSLPYCLQRTGEMPSFFPPLLPRLQRTGEMPSFFPPLLSPEDRGDAVLLPSPIASRGQGRCRPSSLP